MRGHLTVAAWVAAAGAALTKYVSQRTIFAIVCKLGGMLVALALAACNGQAADPAPSRANANSQQSGTDAGDDGAARGSEPERDAAPAQISGAACPSADAACPCPAPERNSACESDGLRCEYPLESGTDGGYVCVCTGGAWRCSAPLPE